MSEVVELSRSEARRIAVRAQLLDDRRPDNLFDVVRRLTMLQVDATASVAPSADLVLFSRLGSAYSPADLGNALDAQQLIDLRGMIRPREDIALYRAEMAEFPGHGEVPHWRLHQQDWAEANRQCRDDILDRLRSDGPLTSRELPDTCRTPWRSSGWNSGRNVSQLLEIMLLRGEVATAGRDGRDRLWDLAERVYPDTPAVPREKALRRRNQRRLESLGIARARGPECAVEPVDVGTAGIPATVEDTRGTWRVDPHQLDQPFNGRTTLLSPFDRLIYDRKRMRELFDFDYAVEIYKPAAKRRWGYFALPILAGDRLIGKVDATADRKNGVLRVDAVHADEKFAKATSAAVNREIEGLAAWLELDLFARS